MDANQFSLRWNNHSCNIVQVFMEQLTNESLVDVTLSCQGQFIKAHKMVLSACSPYFQDLFNVHEVQHPVVILNGVKFKALKLVVEFMYRGETRVLESELNSVFSVAEALQIKGLCNVRKKYTKGPVHIANTSNNNSAEEISENEVYPNDPSEVTAPDPIDFLSGLAQNPDRPRKRKQTSEVEKNLPSENWTKVSRIEEPPKESLPSTTESATPSTSKPTSPNERLIETSLSDNVKNTSRAKVYPAKKLPYKKTPKSPKSVTISSNMAKQQEEENTDVLPFVQVSLNEGTEDDDIDLTSAIKVNPLFIRDIDDADSSWDDPTRLVMDLPSEEGEGEKDEIASHDTNVNSEPAVSTQAPKATSKLKVRATSELVAASKQPNILSKSPSSSSKSSAAAKSNSEGDGKSDKDNQTHYHKQRILFDQLKEKNKGQPPRPPNAFMVFANEWRKKLAIENPEESNKHISVRLGLKWKGLSPENKEIYFSASRRAVEEHKKKYPNYIYSPKEARLRKALMYSLRNQGHCDPEKLPVPNKVTLVEKVKGAFADKVTNKQPRVERIDPLRIAHDVGGSSSYNMVYMEDHDVVVKEELIDDETNPQTFEEEFLRMVEGGHVEAEFEGESGGLNTVPPTPKTDGDGQVGGQS